MGESKQATIERLYHAGASLATILVTVGGDDDTLRLIHRRLGVAMSTLRREADYWIRKEAT